MAERMLQGVGDAALGEWREAGHGGVVHIRRRLALGEADHLVVRDIRGTAEQRMRIRALLRDAPHLRRLVS